MLCCSGHFALELVIGEVMFTQTFIHVLEFAVCVLFIVLFVQVFRGYRKQNLLVQQMAAERAAAAAAQISARARESVLGVRPSNPVPQMVRVRVMSEKAPVAEKTTAEKPKLIKDTVPVLEPVPVSSRDVKPALKPHSTQAFAKLNAANGVSAGPIKASEILLSDYIGEFFTEPVKAAEIMPFKAAVTDAGAVKPVQTGGADAVATVDAVTVVESTRPAELEDDLPITVNADTNVGAPSDRVMSDKVVHAMLDEAKLVCAS